MAKPHPAQGGNPKSQPQPAPTPAVAQTETTTSTTSQAPPDLQAELNRLRAENEALKGAAGVSRDVTLKVSEKGALSAYGMGRFPVTLYREQWEKLLGSADAIREFIKVHDSELKRKEPKQ